MIMYKMLMAQNVAKLIEVPDIIWSTPKTYVHINRFGTTWSLSKDQSHIKTLECSFENSTF